MPDTRWAVAVHGGAKTIEPEERAAHRDGCGRAAQAATTVLRFGGSALQAVQAAVRVLEDDLTFNAGHGAVQNADGGVEMDAAIMEGTTLQCGAVAAVRRVPNPIDVARLVLPADPVLLVSDGAERFAAEHGVVLLPTAEFEEVSQEAMRDTVGAVALDQHGHFAAAASTGGLSGKLPGRVGDSVMPGCGFYADDKLGAAALSGDGEQILRTTLAARIMQELEFWSAGPAAQQAIGRLARVGGQAGAIVVDRLGRIGVAHNSDHFAVAMASSQLDGVQVGIDRHEVEKWVDHG